MKGQTVLVTGAAGFIGRHLVRRLLREGARVRALDWDFPACEVMAREGAELISGDVTEVSSLGTALRGCSTVFHCAAILCDFRSQAFYHHVNVGGTRNVAELALEEGVNRLIHVSSNVVYGFDPGKNVDENAPRRPFGTPYGDTKLEGEILVTRIIRQSGLRAVIVQPTIAYGPFDNLWTRKGMKLLASGLMTLPGKGKGIFQPVYVGDLVEGLYLAAIKGAIGETYILPGPEIVTFRDFYDRIALIVGRGRARTVPKSIALFLARAAELRARITRRSPLFNRESILLASMKSSYSGAKAGRELGFVPGTMLSQGLGFAKTWYERYRDQILSSEERVRELGPMARRPP